MLLGIALTLGLSNINYTPIKISKTPFWATSIVPVKITFPPNPVTYSQYRKCVEFDVVLTICFPKITNLYLHSVLLSRWVVRITLWKEVSKPLVRETLKGKVSQKVSISNPYTFIKL